MNFDALETAFPRPVAGIKTNNPARQAVITDPDNKIIEAVRDGDTEAFGNLVNRYEDFVFTLILRMARSEDMARDIAQETFLRAYRGIRRFELRSSFKTWLYRIAYNTALSHIKREKMEMKEIESTEPSLDTAPSHSLKLTLEKLIGKLKPELQSVIIFHYYDDLKYEEIAEVLQCPIGTVKIRLYRAKYELRKLWARYAI